MTIDRIQLLGAGGHASVVVDALLASGQPSTQIDIWTEGPVSAGQQVLGIPVRRLEHLEALAGLLFHVCIGNNATRRTLQTRLSGLLGGKPFTVTHPDASISAHAQIGAGCFVGARAVVAPRARLGVGTIVNHAAVVDHDCVTGDFVHVAPGAMLGGAVELADGVLVGAGAAILPSRFVRRGCTIGAGSVVVHDTEDNATYVGIPATRLTQRTP